MTVRFLCPLVFALLLFYEILKIVGFVLIQDFNDGQFWLVKRFQ